LQARPYPAKLRPTKPIDIIAQVELSGTVNGAERDGISPAVRKTLSKPAASPSALTPDREDLPIGGQCRPGKGAAGEIINEAQRTAQSCS
jgi:hypothetical protein